MAIYYVPVRSYRRARWISPTFFRRFNESVLVPYRLVMWAAHLTALICAAQGSDTMIRQSSLARGYKEEDYVFLRQTAQLCLAASFLCLVVNLWGVFTGRTLRLSLSNVVQGTCDGAAAVLLIVAWNATAHIARLWHVFYIFSIIPTGLELLILAYSYRTGLDVYT